MEDDTVRVSPGASALRSAAATPSADERLARPQPPSKDGGRDGGVRARGLGLGLGIFILLGVVCGPLVGAHPAYAAPPVGADPGPSARALGGLPGAPLGVSPLRPFGGATQPPGAGPQARADQDPSSAPLLAQLQDPEKVPFATPPANEPDEEDEDEASQKAKQQQKEKQVECDSDAQCPNEAICVKHTCRSRMRPLAAILYYHQPGPIGYRIVLPFYYSVWRPGKSTRALAPLFVDHRNTTEQKRVTWVFPTYEYRRTPELTAHRVWPLLFFQRHTDAENPGTAGGILPLFWASKRRHSTTAVVPPLLFFHHRNNQEQRTDTGFLPLLLYVRKLPQDTLALFLGLGYYRKTPEKTLGGFVPLVFHSRNKEQSRTTVLPLFYSGENFVTGERYTTLLPLFLYRRSADKSRLILTPLGGSYRNEPEESTTTVLLVPPVVRRDDPVRSVTTVLPPLTLWYRNKQTGSSWGYAGPFFYSRDDEGSSEGLVPVYFRVRSRTAQSETHVVPPLLSAFHSSRYLKLGFVGPIYGWSRPDEKASGGGVLPLFSVARGPRPHFLLAPPLLIYTGDRAAGRYHFSLGPLFYRWQVKGENAGYDAGLFPLLWLSRHGKRSTQLLLPLFYHHKEPGSETVVVGPVFWNRRCPCTVDDQSAGVTGGIAPLLFWKRSPQRSYTVLFPLLFHSRTPERSIVVAGPVFWSREKQGEGTLTRGGLFPLVYYSKTPRETFLVGPLFGMRKTPERQTLVFGPFIEHATGIGTPQQSVSRAVLPLYFFHCSPGRRAHVLFPLFMQVQEEKTTFRTVGLLYYGVRRPELSADVLFPLIWSIRGPRRNTTVLGPLFYHRDDEAQSRAVGLIPLFGYGRDKERTAFISPIGFYHRNHTTEHTRSVFLLFYADVQKERDDFGLFPLWFASRRGTNRSVFVTPFFYHSSDPARQRSTTVLGPLYFGRRGAATFGGVAPLFYGRNDGDGGYRFMALPLLYFRHKAGTSPENWLLTPLFGFGQADGGFRAYLGPLYVRSDANVKSFALLPLFYFTRNQRTSAATYMGLPLFFHTASGGRSLTMVTPLFWQYRTLTKRVSLLFPLFLDSHTLHSDRLTAFGPLIPLFTRSYNAMANTTTWLFPPILTYVKQRADGYHNVITFPVFFHFGGKERSSTVIFPIFWYLRRPATQFTALLPLFAYSRNEHNTRWLFLPPLLTFARNFANGDRDRVIFPLFWHFKREKSSTTVFLPFGAHWVNSKGHYTLVLNSYYYKGNPENPQRRGAWHFELWPLIGFGRPHAGDIEWNFLSGLVGYSRDGVKRTLRLLWGVFIPLEPTNVQTTWYGATWRMASE